jgi:hypothetical protein
VLVLDSGDGHDVLPWIENRAIQLPRKSPTPATQCCATALAAADHAVITREIARATAHRLGHRVIFSPVPDPERVGARCPATRGAFARASLRLLPFVKLTS